MVQKRTHEVQDSEQHLFCKSVFRSVFCRDFGTPGTAIRGFRWQIKPKFCQKQCENVDTIWSSFSGCVFCAKAGYSAWKMGSNPAVMVPDRTGHSIPIRTCAKKVCQGQTSKKLKFRCRPYTIYIPLILLMPFSIITIVPIRTRPIAGPRVSRLFIRIIVRVCRFKLL